MFNPLTQDIPVFDFNFPPTMMPVIFSSNGSKLLGTMLVANGEGPHPTILLLHGFPGNENNFDLAHTFCRQGFNVFVFHYRGSWGSGGEFSFFNCIEDVNAAIKFLQSNPVEDFRCDPDRLVLIGHSMGGFTAVKNAIDFDISNIAFLAGFNFGYFAKAMHLIPGAEKMTLEGLAQGAELLNVSSAENLYKEIISNVESWDLLNFCRELTRKNFLILGAKFDAVAPLELHHAPIVKCLKDNGIKNLNEHVLETGHSFSSKRIELAKIISGWLGNINF